MIAFNPSQPTCATVPVDADGLQTEVSEAVLRASPPPG